jgi:hypothetical protein
MIFFHDSAGEREPETGGIALGGVERPENVGQVLRRDTTPVVAELKLQGDSILRYAINCIT